MFTVLDIYSPLFNFKIHQTNVHFYVYENQKLKKITQVSLGNSSSNSSLEPRLTFGGREKRAWYTLSAHAPKFPEILGISIFVRLSVRKREP